MSTQNQKKKLPKGCVWVAGIFALLFIIILLASEGADKAKNNENASADQSKSEQLAGIDSNAIKHEVDSMLKNYLKKRDDFQNVTFYTHKRFGKNWNNRNTIRVVVLDNGSYYMQSNFYGKDWITHTHVIVLIDGITYNSPQISPLSNSHATDNTAYEVWEVNSYNETGDNNLLAYIAAAKDKEIKIRFTGGSRTTDATLSKADKDAIAESLKLALNLSILNKF